MLHQKRGRITVALGVLAIIGFSLWLRALGIHRVITQQAEIRALERQLQDLRDQEQALGDARAQERAWIASYIRKGAKVFGPLPPGAPEWLRESLEKPTADPRPEDLPAPLKGRGF